jgi:hypothetical protein
MEWGTADILAWLDSDEGQKWLNERHQHLRYTYWASIKKDSEGTDAAWHWEPGEKLVSFGTGLVPWREPAITDEVLARPCP